MKLPYIMFQLELWRGCQTKTDGTQACHPLNPNYDCHPILSIQVGLSGHIANKNLFAPKKRTVGGQHWERVFLNVLSFPQCFTTEYTKEIKVATPSLLARVFLFL